MASWLGSKEVMISVAQLQVVAPGARSWNGAPNKGARSKKKKKKKGVPYDCNGGFETQKSAKNPSHEPL